MNEPGAKTNIWQTAILTFLALAAFAANSLLCRMALDQEGIDAASFTTIRLLSGSLTLLLLVYFTARQKASRKKTQNGSWTSGGLLFLYAVCFSYAYVSLETGVGALIAFASVQITMITHGIIKGRSLSRAEWIGVLMAFGGFVYLVSPGISAPSIEGFILMTLSGFGWGMYSVRGLGSVNPLEETAFNFVKSNLFLLFFVALLLIFSLMFPEAVTIQLPRNGIVLAVISGAVTSGLGYTIWYMALKGLSNLQASVFQLLVPVLAALGGIIFLSERVSLRLSLSSLIILGGILMVILGKSGKVSKK
jgi:drug/metabolite transporter (DMT)-like permease